MVVFAKRGGLCATCDDEAVEIDHDIPRAAHGPEEDNLVDLEDSSAFISRFSQETWDGFVEARKPSQIVCNLHEECEGGGVVNIDVRSCRLNALIEAIDPNQRSPEPHGSTPLQRASVVRQGLLRVSAGGWRRYLA